MRSSSINDVGSLSLTKGEFLPVGEGHGIKFIIAFGVPIAGIVGHV
jgi:hypothetical protein